MAATCINKNAKKALSLAIPSGFNYGLLGPISLMSNRQGFVVVNVN